MWLSSIGLQRHRRCDIHGSNTWSRPCMCGHGSCPCDVSGRFDFKLRQRRLAARRCCGDGGRKRGGAGRSGSRACAAQPLRDGVGQVLTSQKVTPTLRRPAYRHPRRHPSGPGATAQIERRLLHSTEEFGLPALCGGWCSFQSCILLAFGSQDLTHRPVDCCPQYCTCSQDLTHRPKQQPTV